MNGLYTGKYLSQQETEWVRARYAQGYSIQRIAHALFVGENSIHAVIRENKFPKGEARKQLPPLPPLPFGVYGEEERQ